MQQKNEPLLLRPSGRNSLWGGTRLNDEFSKNIPMYPLAETWECSTHPAGPSYVMNGIYKEKTLAYVLQQNHAYLGTKHYSKYQLPILIKFIDAKQDLSIQVHPNDAYAKQYEHGQYGKTEMWYVLDATKDAHLYYGLKRNISFDTFQKALLTGNIMKYLQRVPVKKGDIFFIPAGTIHAIGAGALIAEIQESSDLTYRLYDYDRLDNNGKKRELHIQKALDVSCLHASETPRQPMHVFKYKQGVASELLIHCKYFEVYRVIVNTERRQHVIYQTDEISFRVLLCINGCGTLKFNDSSLDIFKGDCVFVPANSCPITFHGKMQFLDVRG